MMGQERENTRVNRGYLQERQRPQLMAESVPGSPEALVVTILAVELQRRGTLVRMVTREFPGHIVWVPQRELLALADILGDEIELWQGRRVVLELVLRNNPTTGGKVRKYVVAHRSRWDAMGVPVSELPEEAPTAAPQRKLRQRRPRGGA